MSVPYGNLVIIFEGKIERRYVYSCPLKPRKFQNDTRWHSGTPRDSVGWHHYIFVVWFS